MNAYIRFKLGLTEENPAIKPYNEKLWAEFSDVQKLPINISLTYCLARWVLRPWIERLCVWLDYRLPVVPPDGCVTGQPLCGPVQRGARFRTPVVGRFPDQPALAEPVPLIVPGGAAVTAPFPVGGTPLATMPHYPTESLSYESVPHRGFERPSFLLTFRFASDETILSIQPITVFIV